MLKNIVVVGGGTAGWLTALHLRKESHFSNITVIESSDIGILGAGEGTVPHFIDFLNSLQINIVDIFKFAKGTVKNGIKFTNWNGDGKHYYHAFTDGVNIFNNQDAVLDKLAWEENLDEYSYTAIISEDNKCKFIQSAEGFGAVGTFAVHFDAVLLAKFLKSAALSRDIKHIDGKVISLETDDEDYITGIQLEDKLVKCDFVFDCTGFHRLIIGKHYKSKWNDYTKHITNNRALPFFLENDTKVIPPYTESIAMKYGWVWKIPVQGRFGCGYVFDSKLATDEEIHTELEEYFQQKITNPRSFSFDAGCFDEVWVKNCIAIGLSSGFIEPLEATSIWVTSISLLRLRMHLAGMMQRDQKEIDSYNAFVKAQNTSVLDFIYLHYISKRNDTAYWNHYKNIDNYPEGVVKYENDVENINNIFGTKVPLFLSDSFIQVGAGINYYNSDKAKELITNKPNVNEIKIKIQENANASMNHYEFVDKMLAL